MYGYYLCEALRYAISIVQVNINMSVMENIIHITENAQAQLLDLLRLSAEKAVLLSVNSKGCGGNSYAMKFVHPDFPGEYVELGEGYRLIIDKKSLLWLVGITIDYLDSGLESRFDFVNPQEVGRCGCNMSFTINPCGTDKMSA